jgi:NADH:ubiquinone oxidoreductase subunit F (NADH-binding)
MGKSILIKDTTPEERMQIVNKALSWCDDSSCENCSGCSMGVGSLTAMYQPYIDGKLEIAEINMLHASHKFTLGGGYNPDQLKPPAGFGRT